MQRVIGLIVFLVSVSAYGDVYTCSGSGYTVKLMNKNLISRNDAAIELTGNGGRTVVLAKDIEDAPGFEIEFSGVTSGSEHGMQSITILVDDYGVPQNTSVKATLNYIKKNETKTLPLVCIRGNDPIPELD